MSGTSSVVVPAGSVSCPKHGIQKVHRAPNGTDWCRACRWGVIRGTCASCGKEIFGGACVSCAGKISLVSEPTRLDKAGAVIRGGIVWTIVLAVFAATFVLGFFAWMAGNIPIILAVDWMDTHNLPIHAALFGLGTSAIVWLLVPNIIYKCFEWLTK